MLLFVKTEAILYQKDNSNKVARCVGCLWQQCINNCFGFMKNIYKLEYLFIYFTWCIFTHTRFAASLWLVAYLVKDFAQGVKGEEAKIII